MEKLYKIKFSITVTVLVSWSLLASTNCKAQDTFMINVLSLKYRTK